MRNTWGEPRDYIFAGNAVTYAQFQKLRETERKGLCPFCVEPFSTRYGAMRRHIRSCSENPRNKKDGHTVPRGVAS